MQREGCDAPVTYTRVQIEQMTTRRGRHVLMVMKWTAAMAAVLGFAVLAAGCGSSNGPGSANSGSTKAQFLTYSRCMRSHGVSDFPDPTTPAGGGVAFSINGGLGSDLIRTIRPTRAPTRRAARYCPPGCSLRLGLLRRSSRRCGGLAACDRTASRASRTQTTRARLTARNSTTPHRRFTPPAKHAPRSNRPERCLLYPGNPNTRAIPRSCGYA